MLTRDSSLIQLDVFCLNARTLIQFYILVNLLPPRARIQKKKGCNWKLSTEESKEHFIHHVKTASEIHMCIDKRKEKATKYGVTVQPYILAVKNQLHFNYKILSNTGFQDSTVLGQTISYYNLNSCICKDVIISYYPPDAIPQTTYVFHLVDKKADSFTIQDSLFSLGLLGFLFYFK